MSRKSTFLLFCFVFSSRLLYAQAGVAPESPVLKELEPVKKGERLLIIAPHPDDESIGCSGVIQQAIAVGAKVKVLYLTNGDHNEVSFIVYEKRLTFKQGEFIHMGQVRQLEAVQAMQLLGLPAEDLIFLGYPDFGTFTVFNKHWQESKPFRDWLTRISSVPYKNVLSPGAPYKGENILNDIKKVLSDYKPDKIFVSHPADVNGDHFTAYLFLQVALRDLRGEFPQPKVYPYLIHCLGWPLPRHYHPELELMPPEKFSNSLIDWGSFRLSDTQLDKKYQTVLSYKSQTESSAFYLLSFIRKNELFGDFPEIELTKQVSVKESSPSFFGFSRMYVDSDLGILGGLEKLQESPEDVSYAVVDEALFIHLEKSKDSVQSLGLQLYLFGYSDKSAFAAMPKVRIIVKRGKVKLFDRGKLMAQQGADIDIGTKAILLRVPLAILGNPDFILTSIKAYSAGALPVSATGFRKIVIKQGG